MVVKSLIYVKTCYKTCFLGIFLWSDIELIVNNSARIALKNKSKITMEILEGTIRKTQPSLTIEMLNKFANMRKIIEGEHTTPKERRKVGFI